MHNSFSLAVIPGDGIGTEVTAATLAIIDAVQQRVGGFSLAYDTISAGASYYSETGQDIEQDGEARAGKADAIFLGAIGLPSIRSADGTEISPHLRLREKYELYAGVRPVKAYPNAPQRLAAPEAAGLDMVIIRECTEGLFYTAAVHNRSPKTDN
ncbi:MAG: isocitrate/isopropylmalate dehydrogenase family protein, partial [Alphaproteobacteria bacterium]|nr:isocitrate/isopropylmalate dehydrogenase family protein [Alphaproteobacteria bacterium]